MFYPNWNDYYDPGLCGDEEAVFFVSYAREPPTVLMATDLAGGSGHEKT